MQGGSQPDQPQRQSALPYLNNHEQLMNEPTFSAVASSSTVKLKRKGSAKGVKSSIYLPIMEEEESKEVKGMENPQGYNNCFINVVIQSLWHLGSFRHRFLEDKAHEHQNEKEELQIKLSVMKMHHSQRMKRYQSVVMPNLKDFMTSSSYSQRPANSARTQSQYEKKKSEKEEPEQRVNTAKEKCLLCNLRELFQEYRDESKDNLLEPSKV